MEPVPLTPELQRLVESHVDLANTIAGRVYRTAPHALDLDELKSLASFGLVKAAARWPAYCEERGFDPTTMDYIQTYFTRRINGEIMDSLRKNDWATRSLRSKSKELQKAGQLEGATEEQMAERSGMTLKEVRHVRVGMDRRPVSIDIEGFDVEATHTVEADHTVNSLLEALMRALQSLPESQQAVLSLHYYSGMELREVARMLKITESRASHLHTEAVLVVWAALRGAAEHRET